MKLAITCEPATALCAKDNAIASELKDAFEAAASHSSVSNVPSSEQKAAIPSGPIR